METIHTVGALTDILRETLERRLPFVWVRGEVTNLSRPGSRHLYFHLKDERAQLQCVWFSHKQRTGAEKFDPLTGEVYESPQPPVAETLRNGMELLCAGAISVYAARGQYQLLVELVQPAGKGLLAQEFEKLKMRLFNAGYFAIERKRPIPANPVRIALITSPKGAAIHDFLELAQARGSGARIRLFPAPVQGDGAAAAITAMIELANSQDWAQAIVLIRGGGSLEDLWAFNEEVLATAVYNSRLPILAGIGHEVDFTLADMTADLRAATPSHAAQLLWPLRRELWQQLDDLETALIRAEGANLVKAEKELARVENALNWLSPAQKLARLREQLGALSSRLARGIMLLLERKEANLAYQIEKCGLGAEKFVMGINLKIDRLAQALKALNPAAPLGRGYARLYNASGPVVSVKQLAPGSPVNAMLADGELSLEVTRITPDSGL